MKILLDKPGGVPVQLAATTKVSRSGGVNVRFVVATPVTIRKGGQSIAAPAGAPLTQLKLSMN